MSSSAVKEITARAEGFYQAQQSLHSLPDPAKYGMGHIYLTKADDPVFQRGVDNLALNDQASGLKLRSPLDTLIQVAAQNDDLNLESEFLAPEVDVSGMNGYFSFTDRSGGLSQLTTIDSIERAINGAVKLVDTNGVEVPGFCRSYGLGSEIDMERVNDIEIEVQQRMNDIMAIISLFRLQQRIAAMKAIAAATSHTWDNTALPDADMRGKIIVAHKASTFRPSRAYIDQGAWATRQAAYEGQNTAGAFAALQRDEKGLANFLRLSGGAMISNAIAKDNTGTIAGLMDNTILLFRNGPNVSRTNTGIMTTFWSNTSNGGRYKSHRREVSEDVLRVAVTFKEVVLITGPVAGSPVREMDVTA